MGFPIMRTQVPDGVRDRLPREAAWLRRLSTRLEEVFTGWGYSEVLSPGFEYLETVMAGAGGARREDLYQLFDRKGRTLALRPDMTTPIARLAASKMAGESLPLRLSYVASVFRHRDRKAESLSEIWQAGVELIGAAGPAADAEVIALACASLGDLGLEGLVIGLGHAGLVDGLFAAAGLAPEAAAELKEAMMSHDLVAYASRIDELDLPPAKADLLRDLATFRGTHAEAVARFAGADDPRIARGLAELGTTLQYLEALGVAGQVTLDLGLVRSLGYYTGVVFEGYAPGVGSPVLGGGRYDNLLAEFGSAAPATGFALELDRLLAALDRQGRLEAPAGPDVLVACPPGQEAAAMACARRLRARGLSVAVDLMGRSGIDLIDYARSLQAGRLVSPDGAELARMGTPHRLSTTLSSIH